VGILLLCLFLKFINQITFLIKDSHLTLKKAISRDKFQDQ
jgi:hypothetical protein